MVKSIKKSVYVTVDGIRKHRMRCPKCGRAAPSDFCIVHGDVKAVDLTTNKKAKKDTRALMKFVKTYKKKETTRKSKRQKR